MASRTARVVVFMPPAVEPGEPPISIRRTIKPCDALDMAGRATVLKPAVLGVTDWKRDVSRRLSVGSAEKSVKKKNAAGRAMRRLVVTRITLLCIR